MFGHRYKITIPAEPGEPTRDEEQVIEGVVYFESRGNRFYYELHDSEPDTGEIDLVPGTSIQIELVHP